MKDGVVEWMSIGEGLQINKTHMHFGELWVVYGMVKKKSDSQIV